MTEESFLHAVWPFSCSRRIRLRRSGKMFSNTTSWNRLPSTVETVPKSQEKRARAPPSPLPLARRILPFRPPLTLLTPLGLASLCYVNCFKLGASSLRLFSILVAFLPPFRAAHTRRPPSAQSLVFVLVYWATKNTPFVEQHPPFGYHFWWSFNHILFPKEIPSFIFYRNVMYLGFYIFDFPYTVRNKMREFGVGSVRLRYRCLACEEEQRDRV